MNSKNQHPKRESKPACDAAGRFISGPALSAGSLDSQLALETEQQNPLTEKDTDMSKPNTTPVASVEGTTTMKNLAERGFSAIKATVTDVAPAAMLDKLPESVKTVAGKTPVSALVGLALYGIWRKFFRKPKV